MNNAKENSRHANNRIAGGVVYFYILFSGLIIVVNASKQANYLEILYGAACVLVCYILYRFRRPRVAAEDNSTL